VSTNSRTKWIFNTLAVNVILVIGHEKLNVEMQKLFGTNGRDMLIMKIPKSGGVSFL
jgi:polyribonucleotide 5'-hydroxyl-kinase